MNFQSVQKKNRDTLRTVSSFIDEKDYQSSPDNYGLPQHVSHLIDLPLNNDLTYVDLVMFLQTQLGVSNPKYVEIGVSVLKTFYQVAHFLDNAELYAFDINNINPTIAKKFELTSEEGQISQYTCGKNKISYFKGDVFSREDLENFKNYVGSKVNIIFSDAHHTGRGIASEYANYINDALADEFILYYDDLENDSMRHIFLEICEDIKKKRPNATSAFVKANGWLGQHEHTHLNGIITSLDLESIIRKNRIPVPISFIRNM